MFRKNFSNSGVDFLVAGLGNPDRKYQNTRHNAGFMMLDYITEKLGVKVNRLKFKSLVGTGAVKGKKVLFMKPSTYMNNSGQAVLEAMNFYKLKPEQVIIIFDDVSLDVGKMRIRKKGSDGGQKGMRSIIYLSGSDEFARIKIGVGKKPNPHWDLANWVLSEFTDGELKALAPVAENAAEALELMINGETDRAMNLFN